MPAPILLFTIVADRSEHADDFPETILVVLGKDGRPFPASLLGRNESSPPVAYFRGLSRKFRILLR